MIGFGAVQPIIDLGRPDRAMNIVLYGSKTSPLLWDVTSIMLYLTASSVYLYVPMIPDLAIIRDLGIRPKWLYWFLAIGYNDTPKQRHTLEKIIAVLAVAVIPVAISVHTVIGWIFALTLRPMWHSTIFGPYFVMGAIYSGIAALIIAMAVLRRVYRLEAYFKDVHFGNMGKLLLLMSCLWFYFTFAEYLTAWYGGDALVVSNHGGRQLDGVAPTLRVLPEVVEAVNGRVEILLDGGIRRGSDIVKAICLGARAVLVGGAYAYGLGAGGEAGVARAIDILRSDVIRTLKLLGCASVPHLARPYVDVPPEWRVRPAPQAPQPRVS